MRLMETFTHFKCDSCGEIHEVEFEPISSREAQKKLICCPSGVFIPLSDQEVMELE